MVVTKGKHLVNQELKGEVRCCLLEVRLYLVLAPGLAVDRRHRLPFYVDAFDIAHCRKQVFDKEGLLNVYGK